MKFEVAVLPVADDSDVAALAGLLPETAGRHGSMAEIKHVVG